MAVNGISGSFPPPIEYKGTFQYPGTQFEKVRDFKCRDDDIWVCSFPRSGTTLTQQIVYLIQTLDFDKAFTTKLDDRFPLLELEIPEIPVYRGPKYLDEQPTNEPRMIKTHLHLFLLPDDLKKGKGKMIYIVRNPKSVILSLYRFLSFLRQTDGVSMRQFIEQFLAGKNIIACPWGLHVAQFWEHKNLDNFLFLQFEELVTDRPGTIRRIAAFLGKELTGADVEKIVECTTIDAMKNNKAVNFDHVAKTLDTAEGHGQFINTGETSGWRKEIPEDMVKLIDEMIEKEIGHTDIKFV